ncbi:MAG: PEP-utilizing enzyme [Candidatus Shapirobacteria bacterium]
MQLSVTSQKILKVFFSQPDKEFFINELIRLTKLYPNSVYKALQTLEKQGMLRSKSDIRFKYYRLNPDYKYLNELKGIVGARFYPSPSVNPEWVKILNRQSSVSFTMALCKSNITNLNQVYGVSVPTHWTNGITYGVYYLKDELTNLGKNVSKKAEVDTNFFDNDVRACRNACNKLITVASKIPSNLSSYTNQKLAKLLKLYYQSYLDVFPFVTVPHGIERYFETKIKEQIKNPKILKIFLSPASIQDDERDDALKLATYVKNNGFNKGSSKLLNQHTQKYCWLSMWSIHAKPLTKTYFETEIKNILDKLNNPQSEIDRMAAGDKEAKELLNKTFEKIKASPTLKKLVNYLQEYIYLRTFRKNSICQAHYYHLPLLFELAKRLKLSLDKIKLLSYEEMIFGIEGKIELIGLKKLVKDRQKGWAICMWQGKSRIITGVKNIIETMERLNIIAASSSMQRVVRGNVASRGMTAGKVKVIRKLSEINKIEKGDILVTRMTTPDYVVAMRKAAAIITDEGGITCHAAIVSREFGIPCIVGTRNATQILNDNDWVEVDAVEGIVKITESISTLEDVKSISGRTIFKGKVKGKVRIILDASDFIKVQKGDILIAAQTTPEYLSLLYRVKGFVVDEDSLTSHAALYGKALKLPSIMGTTYARNVLHDEDMVELDATNGVIKKLT